MSGDRLPRVPTEKQMREHQVPVPRTLFQLARYLGRLLWMRHNRATAIHAVSAAAAATFLHMAYRYGLTGFEAGHADLEILRRTRDIQGPCMLVTLEDDLFPHNRIRTKVSRWLDSKEARAWLAQQAKIKLETYPVRDVAPHVIAHWNALVANRPGANGEDSHGT